MSDTTEWTETYITYTIWCEAPQHNTTLTLTVSPSDYSESDLDTGVIGFATAYNTIYPVTNITKLYTGTGVSSYDFAYASSTDLGDGITLFGEGYSPLVP